MRALITGGGGQLGSDLAALLGADAHTFTHDRLDICDREAVARAVAEVQPEVVFNCAAFHNLDQCEQDPQRAWEVNVEAVRELARLSPRLVHLSTNYVFDGEQSDPYTEHDLPAPQSVYALTKLAGEYAALAYGDRALVVRTGGLYGLQGSASKGGNFVQRMLARARAEGAVRMVADQFVQPTFTADLAQGLIDAVAADAHGVIHLTASGSCSWYEFTVAIMARAGLTVAIEPTVTTVAPGGVRRPANGVLARPATDAWGIPAFPSWEEALSAYMERAGLAADIAQTI